MPRPAALRAGDSARSGSSLGFGARGPRGKITAQTVHVTEAVEVVQSSVPLGIASGDVKLGAREPGASQIEIPTLITWTPDKSHPAPAVASPKLRDSNALPDRRIWSETILLPVGNMSVQFVVDGEPHLTTDLPLAPEEDGTLVNYITVISPTPVEGDAGARENANTPLLHSASRWLKEPGTPDDPSGSSPPWTSDIPEHLINAQQEEEVWEGYKAMTAEQRRAAPVPPAPILPSAPLLPRHLDRPLLNTKSKKAAAANSSTLASHAAAGPGRKSGKDKKGASGSGSGSGGRKGERERNYGPSPLSQDPTGRIGLDPALGLTSAASAGAILVEAPHGDDDAVLPVPSHVVLLHLGTSAIRDGVIAVCDTVRYKRKYITTVFYKPMYTAPDPDAMPDPSVIQPPPVPTLQQPPPGASSPVIAAEA
ncbi:5'-AMP-activated protein kinase beta subunit, interation domain-containing protein [Auriculariales sp. MPI-PUGE-AT-0066]|nr:5'-AMP-activated protein kinase beta subunit, interation domain-containing protein [Auriculariales sp. MPI-PUGE-AT-0066]